MKTILILAGQEIRDGFRNRWIIALTLVLAGFALSLTLLGSAPGGTVGASALLVIIVSLSSLTIFLLPLIGLMLSYDSVVGEIERGTMLLLLAYPVTRWQVMAGKFLGHITILAFATVLGYGLAGGVALYQSETVDSEALSAFAAMTGSSIILGGAFLAIGYLISTCVRERATAGGIAIGVWLFFVLVYDMALLGLLVGQGEAIGNTLFHVLLLANPADAYRLFNLGGFDNVATLSGTIGMMADVKLSSWALGGVQLAWVIVPLSLAALIFSKKEI
ncbi:MAG: ABC transporter permease [Rhodospirillaceae bacterium]|jgi:Cu-processing system permease protein|nr:ABC transporter permease [Rhodospirillaceae bacterium]